jgi:phage shock protein E
MMKKLLLIPILMFTLVACSGTTEETTALNVPVVISASDGKSMLDADDSIILIDVRTQSEYDLEHIEGAILLPLADINTDASKVMKDKSATYIIYCRSGNRSAQAVLLLYQMGYGNLYDMGGIINWPYDTVKG